LAQAILAQAILAQAVFAQSSCFAILSRFSSKMAGGVVEKRLATLGLRIPLGVAPAANYVPWRRSGNMVFISGQIPKNEDGVILKGRLGASCSIDEGKEAARLCAINIISQMKAACDGDLDKVTKVLKVEGFVNAHEDFTDIAEVINGCSDLLCEVFGPDVGPHSRFAAGCSSLPLGISVEIAAVMEASE